MYGYQPPAARRLAPPPEQYADGGLVARMKSADAGPAAFGARGLSQLRDLVPKMAAMGYSQQAAAPAPAPVSDPRVAQLQAMIPQMEAMGYQKRPLTPQMLARGGMVRGPGTGTSDSIPDEAEPGTYIMPADSTAAIGPDALEKMGTVPVRLSDGEFKIPPEQVMALGAAVLKLYKDATHTPVNGEDGGKTDAEVEGDDDDGARGFSPADRMAQMPEQMFADGGAVGYPMQRLDIGQWAQEQEQGRADLELFNARQAKIRQDQADADAEAVAQSEEFKRRQQIQAAPPQALANGGMVDPNRPRSFGDAAAVANDPTTTQVRTSAMDSFGRPPAAAPAAAPAPALGSNLAAVTRMGSFTDPRSTMYDSNPYAASNAAKMAASGQSSRATVEAGMAPAPQPATASNSFGDASAATRDAGVTQVAGYQPGRGTVSTVPAQPVAPRPPAAPAAGFQTAAQRMAAPTPAPAPVQAAAPAAPMGWAERNAQRNAEVSAASITNRPEWNRAAGFQPRRFADGGMVEDDLQKRLMQIPSSAPPGWTGGGGGSGGGGGAGGVTGSWEAPQAAPAPAPAPTQPAGALTRAASMSAPPTPAPAVQAMGTLPLNPNGGQVSAQSMGAADSLVRRGAADAMAQMPSAPQTTVQAPLVRHSGNDWQARKDLENARTSALSITNRPEWSNTGMNRFRGGQAGPSTDVAAYNAMLANDLALRGAQPGLDQAAMKENAENQRSSLRERGLAAQALASERGAMDRTLITERGANTRTGLTTRATLDAERMKTEAVGNKPLNDVQSKALQFGTRMQAAGTVLDGLASKGVDQPGLIKRAADAVGMGGAANWTQSGEQQQVEQAQRDFINAVLRRESGAAIADIEFSNARQQYFPQVGDSPEVIAQKRKNRELATAGVLAEVPDTEARVKQVMATANSRAQAPQTATGNQAPAQAARIDSQEAFAALPSGARFIAPDGTTRVKP